MVALLLVVCTPAHSYADAALFLGEPYGRFGSVNPTGHAAVYLTRVCAASPTRLRRCQPGEAGVVISRYNHIAKRDWIAIPLIPYLYAVDRADQAPSFADAEQVAALRNEYRHRYLQELVPDRATGDPPKGDWIQLVGAAYDRQLTVFKIRTTATQDDDLIRELNARPNKRRFDLLFHNCADFSRDIINSYYHGALRSSFIADLGLTTPKQIAKSLVRYSTQRPELELSAFVIQQIPGSRPDSRSAHGVLESLVKTKKYLVPLSVVQPWLPASFAAGYLVTGRFNPDRYATDRYEPIEIERRARLATSSNSP